MTEENGTQSSSTAPDHENSSVIRIWPLSFVICTKNVKILIIRFFSL